MGTLNVSIDVFPFKYMGEIIVRATRCTDNSEGCLSAFASYLLRIQPHKFTPVFLMQQASEAEQ